MKTILQNLLSLSLVLVVALSSTAAAKKKAKKRRKTNNVQWAFVVVDGAAVYQVPNFDSPILEYLDREKKIRVSKKLYNGIGGLGAFYKVKIGKKRFGYITDVDIRLPGGKFSQAQSSQRDKLNGADPFSDQLESDEPNKKGQDIQSIYFTRYIGLVYSSYGYTEKINNKDRTAATSFFGLKMTGPGAFLGGAPMDLEVLYSSGPSFYNDLFSKASGFLLTLNTQLLLPMLEWPSTLAYYGAGVVITYSNFTLNNQVPPTGSGFSSEEVRVGLAFSLGVARALGRNWALRLEGKYFYEQQQYFGAGGSLQYKW